MNCSKCKKDINEGLLIEITLETNVFAIHKNECDCTCEKEYIPNVSVKTKESLCRDCFNYIAESIKTLL
jgi:hypothetical protein